jgi:imidazole glycerol-phosphate synthase subunit HisH
LIGIVDYGLGNVQAFLNMFKRLGVEAMRARARGDLEGVSGLILPGVGAFDHAMDLLNASGMRPALDEQVRGNRIPVLGVCVGMQIMADGSDEGTKPGLGWIPGRVKAFAGNPSFGALPLPHMGWNDVDVRVRAPLFADFGEKPRFYFLHSYYFDCESPAHIAATAEYGINFPCVVSSGNIHGVQCHPEKSHHFGVQLLRNFASL